MKILEAVTQAGVGTIGYRFECPGCGFAHYIPIKGEDPKHVWRFNGNVDHPTFTPSLLNTWKDEHKIPQRCHLNITNGKIIYHSDSTHPLNLKTVSMIPILEES